MCGAPRVSNGVNSLRINGLAVMKSAFKEPFMRALSELAISYEATMEPRLRF